MNTIETELCIHVLTAALAVTVLAAAAWGITAAWRNASASRRHAVWLAAIAGMAAVPLWQATPLRWPIGGAFGAENPGGAGIGTLHAVEMSGVEVAALDASAAPVFSPERNQLCIAALAIIGLGIVWRLGVLAIGILALIRLRRRAQPADGFLRQRSGADEAPLCVMLSRDIRVPVLAGWRRPVILLPEEADSWRAADLQAAVAHERAHFDRGDHWQLPLLELISAAYWWHPAVRFSLRMLRRERERACDDLAVERGAVRASDYAQALLAAARLAPWRGIGSACGLALAMARRSGVAARVEAVLDCSRRTDAASRAMRAGAVISAAALAACLAGFGPSSPESTAEDSPRDAAAAAPSDEDAAPPPENNPPKIPGESIVLPTFEISEVTLSEAIQQLEQAARKHDPAGAGVRVVRRDGIAEGQRLSLSLTNVTAREALKYVAELAGGELVATEDRLIVRPRNEEPEAAPKPKPGTVPGENIRLPKVQFDRVTPDAAVKWIAAEARSRDPAGKGVAVEIEPDPSGRPQGMLTLSLTDVTVKEALGYVASLASLELTAADGKFILRPKP